MYLKIVGATLIIMGSGGFGLAMVAHHRAEEKMLQQIACVLDYMECELQYRLTPLPVLCKQAAEEAAGILKNIMLDLSYELEDQISPDVSSCMYAAVNKHENIPPLSKKCLITLGSSLGRFDLEGQLKGLEAVRSMCKRMQNTLEKDKDVRRRSYRTLSLCAGAALAILLL